MGSTPRISHTKVAPWFEIVMRTYDVDLPCFHAVRRRRKPISIAANDRDRDRGGSPPSRQDRRLRKTVTEAAKRPPVFLVTAALIRLLSSLRSNAMCMFSILTMTLLVAS